MMRGAEGARADAKFPAWAAHAAAPPRDARILSSVVTGDASGTVLSCCSPGSPAVPPGIASRRKPTRASAGVRGRGWDAARIVDAKGRSFVGEDEEEEASGFGGSSDLLGLENLVEALCDSRFVVLWKSDRIAEVGVWIVVLGKST
ncbi:hypothetical protein KM043_001231 [Ampulex compressa]|nr:hypothetical protein KM043_001231 [Ampulex compressa]